MSLPESLYRAAQTAELDRRAIEEQGIAGYELMQRAGAAAFERLDDMLKESRAPDRGVLVICGGGNNGGDGYVIARLAREAGYSVTLLAMVPEDKLHGAALSAAKDWRACGGSAVNAGQIDFSGYAAIVDALLGTGLQREVSGAFADVVERVNRAGVPALAVDVPSGLSADTGRPLGVAVHATCTITFIGLKQGLFTGSAADYCGRLYFDDLSVSAAVYEQVVPSARRIVAQDVAAALPPRSRTAHKGHFGHVLVVGGERGMAGAARMAAAAALRTGAGLVSVATRPEHAALLGIGQPELMCHGVDGARQLDPLLDKATVVAVGPGLGQSSWAVRLFARLRDSRLPLVVDADGLSLLAADPEARGNWILTPHPGEAARLLGVSTAGVQADRFEAVRTLAERYAATVILKGAGTLIASPEAKEIAVCDRGHPGMASGGMGDILTGIVAGVWGQTGDRYGNEFMVPAATGVWLHAAAAEQAARRGERGIAATDLLAPLQALVNPRG